MVREKGENDGARAGSERRIELYLRAKSNEGLTFIFYDIIILVMSKTGRPKQFRKGVRIMKTMIYLEEEAHTRLKHLAVDERVSMSELIRRAVDELLTRHAGPKKGGRG